MDPARYRTHEIIAYLIGATTAAVRVVRLPPSCNIKVWAAWKERNSATNRSYGQRVRDGGLFGSLKWREKILEFEVIHLGSHISRNGILKY